MSAPLWIHKLLDRWAIPYETRHHAEVYTAQEVAGREHVSGHRVAKVVIVLADGRPVELVLPASRRVCLERVREILDVREVRLATEQEMNHYFSDCEPGAVPPLRHWRNVELLMDASLDVTGDILFQAGTHEDAIRLRFYDWYRVVNPWVEMFTEPAEPGLATPPDPVEGRWV